MPLLCFLLLLFPVSIEYIGIDSVEYLFFMFEIYLLFIAFLEH